MKIIISVIISMLILTTVLTAILSPKLHAQVKFTEPKRIEKQESPAQELKWNEWHSTVLNKLMDMSKAPSDQPVGTINYITFDVDIEGNITNIKITTEPEKYTQSAKKHFTKYIRELDGNEILKFPQDSQRKVSHFEANVQKSLVTRYSKPEDFSDTEKVQILK